MHQSEKVERLPVLVCGTCVDWIVEGEGLVCIQDGPPAAGWYMWPDASDIASVPHGCCIPSGQSLCSQSPLASTLRAGHGPGGERALRDKEEQEEMGKGKGGWKLGLGDNGSVVLFVERGIVVRGACWGAAHSDYSV